jgi:hypothetical protein
MGYQYQIIPLYFAGIIFFMIQRIQSIWLLLSSLIIVILSRLPIYVGSLGDGSKKELMTAERLHMMILALLLIILPIIAIFLFKNRTGQKQIIWLHILLNLLLLLFFYMAKSAFVEGQQPEFVSSRYGIAVIIPVLSIILDVMAFRGVRSDEKLIKAADKFR